MNYFQDKKKMMTDKIVESTGIPCILTKSKGKNLKDYKIYGNSEQDGTPTPTEPIEVVSLGENSKNLFNSSLWEQSNLVNGVTVQYLKDEDCFLLNGTSTATGDLALKNINIPVKSAKYSLSVKYISGSITKQRDYLTAVAYFGKNNNKSVRTNWQDIPLLNSDKVINNISIDTSYITCFWFYYDKGVTFNNYKVKIQLEEGSTATEYNPYHFIDVNSEGKNLFDPTFVNSVLYEKNRNYHYLKTTIDGLECYELKTNESYIPILTNFKTNTQYTISGNFRGTIMYSNSARLYFKYNDGTYSFFGALNTYWVNIIKISTAGKTVIEFGAYSINGINYPSYSYDLQLEEGSTATKYEPYQEPIITTISLTGHEPLRKIGDVEDYIDYKNKKIVRNIGKHTFENATELTLINSYTSVAYASIKKTSDDKNYGKTSTSNVISETHVININSSYNSINMINCFRSSSINTYYFGFPYGTTLEEMQNAMLGTSYYYQLATPIEENFESPTVPTVKNTCTLTANDEEIEASNIYAKYISK